MYFSEPGNAGNQEDINLINVSYENIHQEFEPSDTSRKLVPVPIIESDRYEYF